MRSCCCFLLLLLLPRVLHLSSVALGQAAYGILSPEDDYFSAYQWWAQIFAVQLSVSVASVTISDRAWMEVSGKMKP